MKTWEDYKATHEDTMRYHDMVKSYNGTYFRDAAEVGDGATVHYYSDSDAYTIIKRTAKTLTLRRCKAMLKPEFKPKWIPGGFVGHCTNQNEQEYDYEEDENGRTVKAYWSETKQGFYVEGCLYVTPGRREYYDYNF